MKQDADVAAKPTWWEMLWNKVYIAEQLLWLVILVINLVLLLDTEQDLHGDIDKRLNICTIAFSGALIVITTLREHHANDLIQPLWRRIITQVQAPLLALVLSAVVVGKHIECELDAFSQPPTNPVHCIVRYSSAAAIVAVFVSVSVQALWMRANAGKAGSDRAPAPVEMANLLVQPKDTRINFNLRPL